MANPAPTINQINAFNATQGTIIDFNIIGGTELVRSNRIYIYDLSDNSLICTHLYVSTESIHELPANTDSSIIYESGKSSADFVNGAQYYAQIQTYTDTAGTEGGSGLSVAKMFWCLVDPTLTITAIPSTISTTSYNISATYNANTSVVSNIIQQYQFNLYSATGSLLQSSGVVVGSGEQQGTSTTYGISYNFTGLSVGSSYYVVVDVTTTQGMSISTQSNTFTVSIDTPTLGEATVVNNACDGYISVTSNLSGEYGGSASGEIATFETDSVNDVSLLKVSLEPQQDGTPWIGTDEDTAPYTFRAMPTQSNDYNRESLNQIVGGTVAWNQLYNPSGSQGVSDGGLTLTRDTENATWTLNGTTTSKGNKFGLGVKNTQNHIYFLADNTNQSSVNIHLSSQSFGQDRGNGAIIKNTSAYTTWYYVFNVQVDVGTEISNLVLRPMVIDLTAMFGSTIADYIYSLEQVTAGAGVAWFKKLFPKDYYEYNAGELLSVEGLESHDTVGFNQWDEEWEVGGINSNTGEPLEANDRIRSKNYSSCFPNTNYYCRIGSSGVSLYAWFYDADKNFISGAGVGNRITTFPNNARYFKLSTYGGNYSTYKNDICINLSWSGYRNGEYEEYTKHSYLLDNSITLRGIPKLDASNNLYYDGDTYESDGTVTRKWGFYTIQTSDITLDDGGGYTNVVCAKIQNLPGMLKTNAKQAIHSKYGVAQVVWPFDNTSNIGKFANNPATQAYWFIFPVDTTIEQMKSALAGTTIVYELATPTTETADPYTNPQIVDPDGTEEYVTSNYVPVGHDSTYSLVCPISGYDEVSAIVSPTTDAEDGQTYTADLGRTVYGGTVDLVTGEVEAYPYYASYNGETLTGEWISDRDPYVAGMSPSIGAQVVNIGAAPVSLTITPQEIRTLLGANNVWSNAGDVEITYNIPITNLLVKRQDVADVSGTWLTLYSQPITQASDMDFTFIDFLNQYGKTYKYALVPLLTQQQSGVEVEVEGGYTVSDEVQSIFDGVFIVDQTGSQKCKANVGYGDVDMNQSVGTITPIGAKYPVVITNSKNQYHNGSISGTIVPDDYYFNGNLSRIDMVNKRNELEQFLTNKRAKIIKDWNSNIWLVMIIDNINCSFDNNYGMGMVNFNASWIEVGDPTNQQDLQAAGLIDVGGV